MTDHAAAAVAEEPTETVLPERRKQRETQTEEAAAL